MDVNIWLLACLILSMGCESNELLNATPKELYIWLFLWFIQHVLVMMEHSVLLKIKMWREFIGPRRIFDSKNFMFNRTLYVNEYLNAYPPGLYDDDRSCVTRDFISINWSWFMMRLLFWEQKEKSVCWHYALFSHKTLRADLVFIHRLSWVAEVAVKIVKLCVFIFLDP